MSERMRCVVANPKTENISAMAIVVMAPQIVVCKKHGLHYGLQLLRLSARLGGQSPKVLVGAFATLSQLYFGCVVETDDCSHARTPVYAVHNVHRIRTGMPKAHSNNVSDLHRQLFFLGCARAPSHSA
jgi:hypothetical protein